MIVIKLQGGLGNQLFQWALGRSLGISLREKVYYDLSFLIKGNVSTKREYELNIYENANIDIFQNDFDIRSWSDEPNKQFLKISDDFHFKNFSLNENYHLYFDGYWQSEKYFSDIREIILDELELSSDNKIKLDSKYKMLDKNLTSLHIRRTDYTSSNGFHPVQDLDYYDKALEIIGKYDNLMIFSDDIEWCKNNLKYDRMIFVEGNKNYEDIYLMSKCNNNILANSSFSWWGAWLNKNNNKKVISPSKWFGESANIYTGDIIPNDWIKI